MNFEHLHRLADAADCGEKFAEHLRLLGEHPDAAIVAERVNSFRQRRRQAIEALDEKSLALHEKSLRQHQLDRMNPGAAERGRQILGGLLG